MLIREPSGGPELLSRGLALTGHYELHVTRRPMTGDGWVRWPDLTSAATLRKLEDEAACRYGGDTPEQHAIGLGLTVGGIASALGFALTGALCVGDRAVRLKSPGLAVHQTPEGVDALAVCPTAVAVVDDPGCADQVTATGYAGLVTPLLRGVVPLLRRSLRTVWVDAADRLVSALFRNSHALRRGDAAVRADRLLCHLPDAMRHRIRVMDVRCGEATVVWKRRAVCCFSHRTVQSGGKLCATCPRLPSGESAGRVAEWLSSLEP